ncbi:MAG: hypothetical protein CVU29_00520 [Betaproteobacteria bacterium HGW-Betaproteobacteria-22]|nr:MAG: hypothetical protein CVU29_00520 [Betaproteobacteria bacterium HGW-Betaproteobacteria-22]
MIQGNAESAGRMAVTVKLVYAKMPCANASICSATGYAETKICAAFSLNILGNSRAWPRT